MGKVIPVDQRRAAIRGLQLGNHYSLQVVPLTRLSTIEEGDEYDPDQHGHFLPGPRLEVDFRDLVDVPSKFWIESITGRSAMLCWSQRTSLFDHEDPTCFSFSVQSSSNVKSQPEGLRLFLWNSDEQTREQAKIISLSSKSPSRSLFSMCESFLRLDDQSNHRLKHLQRATNYHVQLEAFQRRRYPNSSDRETFLVSTTTEIVPFRTGAPPTAPKNVVVLASTNSSVRIGFDPFIEHHCEIISLRVLCQVVSPAVHTKDIRLDLTPDLTEFTLTDLIEQTEYQLTIFAITDEYLQEIRCEDIRQLSKQLKLSDWLTKTSLLFVTSGCQPAGQIHIREATIESMKIQWTPAQVFGSTRHLEQRLEWRREQNGQTQSMQLDRKDVEATIPGIHPTGLYNIFLHSIFSVKTALSINDEEDRKELCLTTTESTAIRFRTPGLCERPEVFLTGYTCDTVDLTWNKPNMFNAVDHPERLSEQIQIHRRLLGYRIDINGHKHNTLDDNQYQCTLTECLPGEEYKVQLVAKTVIQTEYINETVSASTQRDKRPKTTFFL